MASRDVGATAKAATRERKGTGQPTPWTNLMYKWPHFVLNACWLIVWVTAQDLERTRLKALVEYQGHLLRDYDMKQVLLS